jgi:hypothetical protein
MVSKLALRSFCVEGRYTIPSADKSWPAFWWAGATSGGDASEIDFEQPVTPNQGIHDVTMNNHPTEGANITIFDNLFTTQFMNYYGAYATPVFDGSSAPHYYMTCYDDTGDGHLTRYIDGKAIYSATWKWNADLGGTGFGPDPITIANLAVGGDWPGNLSDPSSYSGDMDLYSIDYYGP